MRYRYLTSGLAVLAAAWLLPAPAAGQTPAPAAAAKTATTSKAAPASATPKTPWGDPDLQGVWTHYDETPLQTPDPDPVSRAAAAKAASTRYGPEGQGDFVNGGMAEEKPGARPVPSKRRSMVVEPQNGRIPVLPGKVVLYNKDARGDTWENHNPGERCITRGEPANMFTGLGYGRGFRILQSPGYVVIFPEMIHETRIIPVDGRPHVGQAIRLWNGDPIGHWEGQTLVVESTNYNNMGEVVGGIPQTETLRVVERFTRIDATTIHEELTFEDPKMFTQPWKAELPHQLDPAYQIYEYACHEGNYNYMEGSLRNGRFRDKLAAEGQSK